MHLPKFEIYEVDHFDHHLKVINAPQCLPREEQYDKNTEFYERVLEEVKHNVDLRVDVRVDTGEQQEEEL